MEVSRPVLSDVVAKKLFISARYSVAVWLSFSCFNAAIIFSRGDDDGVQVLAGRRNCVFDAHAESPVCSVSRSDTGAGSDV